MSDAAAAASSETRRLGRSALSLGAANAFDYALQFLLPVVLVRCLEPDDFGQYRLAWLAAGTAMAVVTQAMAGSLYYYLPRCDAAGKRLYIRQTLLFVAMAGLVAALAVSAWNPWLPESMRALARHEPLVPLFVALWVMASPFDLLAGAEERVRWQARATLGLAATRTFALSAAALLTRQLEPVLLVLVGFVAFKCALLLGYVARHHGLRGPWLSPRVFASQIGYAAPFGAAGALYGLRAQADQWIAAALFPLGQFAAFSIGALLAPLVQLVRQPVLQAFLPSMSRLESGGDLGGVVALNRRANVLVAALVYPLLAFAFAFAEDIVTLVYTAVYVDAASVMRIYIAGLAALVLELATTMQLLRQGSFMLGTSASFLALSVLLSWAGAQALGLAGAALGSVVAVYADQGTMLGRISRRTGIALRQLQDWRALGLLLAFSVLAAALAWALVGHRWSGASPMLRVFAGATIVALTYGAMAVSSGVAREA